MTPNLTRLRSELSKLLPLTQPQQVALLDELTGIYPHSIESAGSGPIEWVRQCNCYAFAFGLVAFPEFWDLKDHPVSPVVDLEFVAATLATTHEKLQAEATNEDVVIYSTEATIVHAGIVNGPRVRSKWGNTFIWDH